MTRIFHACDVHGSELVWKKMIKMGTFHKAKALLMCGDITGKATVPIVKQNQGEWFCSWGRHQGETMRSEQELEKMKTLIRDRGYYPFETRREEVEDLKANPKKVHELFVTLMKETLRRWLDMVAEVTPKDVTVVVNPGNDDPLEIDDTIKQDDRVIYALDKIVQLDSNHELISFAHVNPSPWNTPREAPEEELRKMLEKLFEKATKPETLVCNFHCPPYDTHLDIAQKLDKNLKPVTHFGSSVKIHVGSLAIRELSLIHISEPTRPY